MTNDRRLELEVTVEGTPEEVWQAIATGPGISSWYVPHVVEERAGGAANASFGEGPEMQIAGVVAAWEPPRRIVFAGADGNSPFAFEWLVEARDQGSCVVRLVQSGFGTGEEWDAQYDAMEGGWKLFLRNLQLHCAHFRGRSGVSMQPMAMWSGASADAWARLCDGLGVSTAPAAGERVSVVVPGAAPLAGTVVDGGPGRLALLLDEPAAGTAILAAETAGPGCGVSVWSYLYGPDAAGIVARDRPAWQAWLDARA